MNNTVKKNGSGASEQSESPLPTEGQPSLPVELHHTGAEAWLAEAQRGDVEHMDALRAALSTAEEDGRRLAGIVAAIEELANRQIGWSPDFHAAVKRATVEAFDKLVGASVAQDGLLGALRVARKLAVAMSAPGVADEPTT
jgi:hypothetical protein